MKNKDNKINKKVRFNTTFNHDFLVQLKILAAKSNMNVNDLIEKEFNNLFEEIEWDKPCNTSHVKQG